jgi:hypothetical protein
MLTQDERRRVAEVLAEAIARYAALQQPAPAELLAQYRAVWPEPIQTQDPPDLLTRAPSQNPDAQAIRELWAIARWPASHAEQLIAAGVTIDEARRRVFEEMRRFCHIDRQDPPNLLVRG